jgi:Flp pilus assembly protein TadD
MMKEADFAFRQAFAFCPFSPEAVSRYSYLLASAGRLDDAERIAETALRFDRENPFIQSLLNQIKGARQSQGQFTQAQQKLGQLELQFKTNPGDAKVAFELSSLYLQMQQTSAAFHILDQLIDSPKADTTILLSVAGAYAQLQQGARLEGVLQRLVKLAPENPEAWYDLATTQAQLGKSNEALQSLAKALNLSGQRLGKQPKAPDLRSNAATNPSFASLYNRPEFQKLVAQSQ